MTRRLLMSGAGLGPTSFVEMPNWSGYGRELIARIHAIVRRSKRQPERIIRTGKIAVNLDAETVEVDGKMVHLTEFEYKVLELLSLRKGATLTKAALL